MVRSRMRGYVLRIKWISHLRMYPQRAIREGGALRLVRIVRHSHGVWVSLCLAVKKRALEPSSETVGIEMGVRARMTLSDRSVVEAARVDRLTVRSRNACHQASTRIVRRFGAIVVEDLRIRNMTAAARGKLQEPGRNVTAKAGFNRRILTLTWGWLGINSGIRQSRSVGSMPPSNLRSRRRIATAAGSEAIRAEAGSFAVSRVV